MTVPPVAAHAAPAPAKPAASRAKRIAAGVWTGFLVTVCVLLAISAGGTYGIPEHSSLPPAIRAVAFFATFGMMGVAVLLVWRHRYPVLVTGVAALCTAVFPTTVMTVLVASAALAAQRTGRVRWLMLTAVWASVSVGLWWNLALATSSLASLAGDPELGSPGRAVMAAFVPLIAAGMMLPFVGFGIARRTGHERDDAQAGAAAAARNVAVLHEEVERERERQHLARELHDTLAARLSAVSLHAGALELRADQGDEQTAHAARRVREAAQGSLDELRGLVQMLKNPAEAASGVGIEDLAALLDGAVADGADVRAQVFLSGTAGCDHDVSHAVYRLVQESVSNARRHAPGTTIRVDLRGGPETGLTLQVLNSRSPGSARTSVGGGHGLAGMQERAALLGGTFQAGPTPDGGFAVVAWLPWTRADA